MCVLQSWVTNLGLRHQGVLLSAVRGCDCVPKEDQSKSLVRAMRGQILNSFSDQPSSFIEYVFRGDELERRMDAVLSSFDHYPVHWWLHLVHASEIIGYCAPPGLATPWLRFYRKACKKMHLRPETKSQMEDRLNASEENFAQQNK